MDFKAYNDKPKTNITLTDLSKLTGVSLVYIYTACIELGIGIPHIHERLAQSDIDEIKIKISPFYGI